MNSLEDIERAIDGLKPQELAKQTVLEQGLGLFGSPEDAKLLDEVVDLAYEERGGPVKRGCLPRI
jgi:hypothetical protein